MVSLRYCRLGGISPQATSIVVVKRMLISPIVFILYSKLSNGLAPNVCVYAGCGFRSHDKSPWVNEVTKTKLQTNTQTRSLHKHAVAGSGASTPNLFCNQTVHRYGLSFTVRFTFIISYRDSSTCLFSVARRPVSAVTLIRHCHMCKKKSTVPEVSLLSCLLTALLAVTRPEKSLHFLVRSPDSNLHFLVSPKIALHLITG